MTDEELRLQVYKFTYEQFGHYKINGHIDRFNKELMDTYRFVKTASFPANPALNKDRDRITEK